MSRYGESDSYTYPDSEILKNKGDLHDQAALDAFEADATAIRLLEMIEHPVAGNFGLAHLQAMHRHLFQDVYDRAEAVAWCSIALSISNIYVTM